MALGCKAGRLEESGSRINRAMKLSSEHCTFVPSLGRVEHSTEEQDRKEKDLTSEEGIIYLWKIL